MKQEAAFPAHLETCAAEVGAQQRDQGTKHQAKENSNLFSSGRGVSYLRGFDADECKAHCLEGLAP